MKLMLFIILALSLSTFSYGQDSLNKSTIYVEALGNGMFGSINYERQLTTTPGLGIRIGVGVFAGDILYLTVPVGVNYLFPISKNHNSFIEAGFGATWTKLNGDLFTDNKNDSARSFISFIPSIGYRHHTATDVVWRISFTPVFNKYTFTPWAGISIGKRF